MDTTASGRQTVHIAPSTCPIATCLRCLVCGQREGCSCQPRPWNGKKGDLSNWAFKQHRRVFTKQADNKQTSQFMESLCCMHLLYYVFFWLFSFYFFGT